MSTVVVAAWGGGVNSTALLIEWLRLGEQVDLVLFADTGGEKPETYAFRDTFAVWLKGQTAAPFVTVRANSKHDSLEAETLNHHGLPSKAFGYSKCSMRWKVEPQSVFLNNWPPAREAWASGEIITKLVGFDADESRRAMKKQDEPHKYRNRYPLIEWGWGRDECAAAIARAGLPVPLKSSCFFCPNMKEREVLDLRDRHPDLLQRALAMEANWRKSPGSSIVGLGRNFSWRGLLETERRQGKLFAPRPGPADDMPCGCYDGEDQ